EAEFPANCEKFPANSRISGNLAGADRFDEDCIHHHAFPRTGRFPRNFQKARTWRAPTSAFRSPWRSFPAWRRFWASCLWPRESRFPETETLLGRDAVRMSLLCDQTQHLTLTRPFDGEVAESGHAHSVGEPPIDGRLDEVRCEERERDCQVD